MPPRRRLFQAWSSSPWCESLLPSSVTRPGRRSLLPRQTRWCWGSRGSPLICSTNLSFSPTVSFSTRGLPVLLDCRSRACCTSSSSSGRFRGETSWLGSKTPAETWPFSCPRLGVARGSANATSPTPSTLRSNRGFSPNPAWLVPARDRSVRQNNGVHGEPSTW